MSGERRVEWHKAPDFAEVAEALGVLTTQIMAVQDPQRDSVLVLYTPELPPSTLIYSVTLKRGVDGVLFIASEPTAHPGMWEKIVEQAEHELPDIIDKRIEESE